MRPPQRASHLPARPPPPHPGSAAPSTLPTLPARGPLNRPVPGRWAPRLHPAAWPRGSAPLSEERCKVSVRRWRLWSRSQSSGLRESGTFQEGGAQAPVGPAGRGTSGAAPGKTRDRPPRRRLPRGGAPTCPARSAACPAHNPAPPRPSNQGSRALSQPLGEGPEEEGAATQ